MADKIAINVKPWVGEYDFDLDVPFTVLEWRWLKKIAGCTPATLDDNWRAQDPDVVVAFAVIALARAGKIQKGDALSVADSFADTPFDGVAISFIGEVVEEDVPPSLPAATPETVQPPTSGGGSSSQTSDRSGSPPRPIGLPGSQRSSISDRETSVV